jgi:ACR3 family arsenite efflux pump ArsB
MDLKAVIKKKNEQLSLQNSLLQQHLCARVNAPEFGSFLLTFIVAPFIVGVITRRAIGSKDSASHRLYRAILPGWQFWSLF